MGKWKTEDHFVSWLRLCPDNRISGNKVIKECGWKGGDRGGLAQWEQLEKEETKKKKEKMEKMKEKT